MNRRVKLEQEAFVRGKQAIGVGVQVWRDRRATVRRRRGNQPGRLFRQTGEEQVRIRRGGEERSDALRMRSVREPALKIRVDTTNKGRRRRSDAQGIGGARGEACSTGVVGRQRDRGGGFIEGHARRGGLARGREASRATCPPALFRATFACVGQRHGVAHRLE